MGWKEMGARIAEKGKICWSEIKEAAFVRADDGDGRVTASAINSGRALRRLSDSKAQIVPLIILATSVERLDSVFHIFFEERRIKHKYFL